MTVSGGEAHAYFALLRAPPPQASFAIPWHHLSLYHLPALHLHPPPNPQPALSIERRWREKVEHIHRCIFLAVPVHLSIRSDRTLPTPISLRSNPTNPLPIPTYPIPPLLNPYPTPTEPQCVRLSVCPSLVFEICGGNTPPCSCGGSGPQEPAQRMMGFRMTRQTRRRVCACTHKHLRVGGHFLQLHTMREPLTLAGDSFASVSSLLLATT